MNWYPSPYGPDDQIGMLNEIKPTNIIRAARLVQVGTVYDLSHILDEDVPAFPGRTFSQSVRTTAHQINKRRPDSGDQGGWGQNNMNWIIDLVASTSQMGTHLDGLNHIQIGNRFYNGHRLDDLVENWGTNKLGIETTPQIVTRGVLADIAALHDVERLESGYVITVDDAKSALHRQRTTVSPADALFFHTGWGQLWMVDNERYLSGEPGPGMAVAQWMVEQGVALSGCDTWSYGPVPPEDPGRPFEVPQTLNVKHGMFIVENLRLGEIAAAAVHEFMLVLSHARVRGATGAWVAPVAIV